MCDQTVTFTLFSSRASCSLLQQVFSVNREVVVLVVRKREADVEEAKEEKEEAESCTEVAIERARRNRAEEGECCDID